MKLLLENWREYLNEGLDLSKYYIVIEPSSGWMPGGRAKVLDVQWLPGGKQKTKEWEYGNTQNLFFMSLYEGGQQENDSDNKVMTFWAQKYEGILGHTDIGDIVWKCKSQVPETLENNWCAQSTVEKLNFRTTEGDPLYCAGFDVDEWAEQPSYRLGFLALAFWETMIAYLRDVEGAEYYGRHEAVLVGGGTSFEADKLLQHLSTKGLLQPLEKEWFAPEVESREKSGLKPFRTVEGEYAIYKITGKAQIKFEIKD